MSDSLSTVACLGTDQAANMVQLIERWLPIAELGIESQRERGASSALPPLYFMHIWWARKPLIPARAAILASVLPSWSTDWPTDLLERFPTEEYYLHWFTSLVGIRGDPIASKRLAEYANSRGVKLKVNPYDYPRGFTVSPSEHDLTIMLELLKCRWGSSTIKVMDPMAGGGSIPFEALRYGFTTYANELNPVASIILAATLDYPARLGPGFETVIRRYGKLLSERVEAKLCSFFPRMAGESIFAYVWARTVKCPSTGKLVPLAPAWWLQKTDDPIAVRLDCPPERTECDFQVVRGVAAVSSHPDRGTVRQGTGISPWTGDIIDGDYIKREAQNGRLGQQLYAIGVQMPNGRKSYRSPTDVDLEAVAAAEKEYARNLQSWQARGLVPDEEIAEPTNYARGHRLYGMSHWHDLFSPRQLLALSTYVETLNELTAEIDRDLPPTESRAVCTYLALAIDKCADYNSLMTRLHMARGTITNTFDGHKFSFKWNPAEFDAAHNLMPWAIDQVVDAYHGISELAQPTRFPLWHQMSSAPVSRLQVSGGSAAFLSTVESDSLELICVDPPYADSVQYAELSDFFYVWLKRTVGRIYPDWFSTSVVDKDEEAVANPARFAAFGSKRNVLAEQDYERKMAAAFREMHRVLRSDGVLTVMFTHKQVEAWNTLATALINAGFRIQSTWPVHTESEHSLHQAKRNAAASTILLVCRKRQAQTEPVWWEDLKTMVRRVARERAAEFAKQGISGVDLYISAFGPALAVISEHWPVLTSEVDEKTGQPKPLRPEVALDLAREEVIGLRKQGLLLGRQVQFDPATDWYLMAWDAFKAEEFPADEARKLAIALGLDLEANVVRQHRLVAKKQSSVVLQFPRARRRNGVVDPDVTHFGSWVDAAHTAMLVYEEDGPLACEQFLKRTGLMTDGTFKACLQAMINAIPRTKIKDSFARPEAATLDRLRQAFFEDLEVPAEEAPPAAVERQLALLGEPEGEELAEEAEEE